MKVRDLIALLQQQPDATVVVDGYESGYDDPIIHYAAMNPKADKDPECGNHDDLLRTGPEDWYGAGKHHAPISTVVPVVVVSRFAPRDNEEGERTWEAAQALAARWREGTP